MSKRELNKFGVVVVAGAYLLFLMTLALIATSCDNDGEIEGFGAVPLPIVHGGDDYINIPVGRDGIDGTNGIDGRDGSDGQDAFSLFIDPCGPTDGEFDEVLAVFPDAAIVTDAQGNEETYESYFLMWLKNEGLVFLKCGLTYRTTDKQKCIFKLTSKEEGCKYVEVGPQTEIEANK